MPKNEKMPGGNINRRSFLKGIAATGAIATLTSSHPAAASEQAGKNKIPAKSWRDKPDPIDERLISDGGSYDVVVVGGGNAGLICARSAAINGASVAVIEDQAEKGYIPGVGCQCGTINSQYVLDHGAPRTDEADFLREWARRNVIRHNPKRASYFVKNSGRIFDWLLSIADKEWLAENCHAMSCPPKSTVLREISGWKFYYGTVAFECHNQPFNKSWSGLLRMHHEKAMADGAKWFFQHHAEICDVDGSGAVTGIVAKKADGKYIRFKARKGVALCAGGFAGNPEMVIDILDTVRNEAEARGEDLNLLLKNASGGMMGGGMSLARDGSSIKLGIWAGGHIEIGPRSTMGQGDPGTGPWFVQLNRNGERFCDEAAGTALSQPDSIALVTLYDANWKKILEMMPPRHGAPDTADPGEMSKRLSHLDNIKPGPPSKDQQPMGVGYYGLPGVTGITCCANTIEELLDFMGCYKGEARKKALAEIKRYNEMCEKGVDEDFGKDPRIMKVTALKDPPFYGSVSGGGGLGAGGMGGGLNAGMVTTTGLDTDADGHVLNSDFEPIKGLYAAGNNAGGRFIVVYQSPIAGISIGMAITEGYMLGERLAGL